MIDLEVSQPTTPWWPWLVSCVRRLDISWPQTSIVTCRGTWFSLWCTAIIWGFRKYSCETRLYDTVQDFYNILEAVERLDDVVLNFSKAFGKVPHEWLMSKLLHCAMQGYTRRWICHWLTGRKQWVVVDGTESPVSPVESPRAEYLDHCCFLHSSTTRSELQYLPLCRRHTTAYGPRKTITRCEKTMDTLAYWVHMVKHHQVLHLAHHDHIPEEAGNLHPLFDEWQRAGICSCPLSH